MKVIKLTESRNDLAKNIRSGKLKHGNSLVDKNASKEEIADADNYDPNFGYEWDKDDNTEIQIQDREMHTYELGKHTPKVSSKSWGRIWKDGKLEKQFDGSKYEVRKDMANYLDTNESLNEDYGWEIRPDKAWDAYNEVLEYLGAEELCDSLARAMGDEMLGDLLAFICRMNDLEIDSLEGNYNADDEEEQLDEANLHKKFKDDIKRDYKDYDREQDRIKAKRAELDDEFSDMQNLTPEQKAKLDNLKDKIAGKESDFEYKFPHGLEKHDFPYYVTFYEEYPIYEPAEGGYYYAGANAISSKGCNSIEEAEKYLEKEVADWDWEDWQPIEFNGKIKGYRVPSKYIGEEKYAMIETNKEYLSQIRGYEPYQ